MIKSSIQYQIKYRLQFKSKLILMIVDSTSGCKVKEGKNHQLTRLSHFTTRKSSILVYFGTLPRESAAVSIPHAAGALAPAPACGDKLQAGSCKLGTIS